jgi:RecG-like helicase
MTSSGPGLLARLARRITPSTATDVEAAELRSAAEHSGATHVVSCRAGERAVVAGTVRSLTLRPRGGAPALEAELYDGSGRIVLVWLGRRRIAGVEPGREMVAAGRITRDRDTLMIFNPRYELRPGAGD